MSQEGQPRVSPTLQALLVCERVETQPDGAHTLHRIFDQINGTLEGTIPADAPAGIGDNVIPQGVQIPIKFVVFTRWGAGVGHFKHQLRIVNPSSETLELGESDFWLASKATAHNIVATIELGIREPGHYKIQAVLDGQMMGEYVLRVEITARIRRQPPPS